MLVQIEYQEPVEQSGEEFSLRIPMVVGPRYNPQPLVQSVELRPNGNMPRFASVLLAAGILLFGEGALIHAKAFVAQILLRRAFDRAIATGHDVKPWSWADRWPIARIEIKRLHADAIVLAGTSGQALAFGPGHVDLTPNAGERGVAVYSAHRDTHFRFLKNAVAGDEIDVTRNDGRIFHCRVDGSSVVRFDASGIDPLRDGYELVLSTCWPFDAITPGPDRYVVHATMIQPARPSRP